MLHPLRQLVADQKNGLKRGITSICSANAYVLEAAMENAKKHDQFVCIEATANQVNQYGGYTGMTPADFAGFVESLAIKSGFGTDRLILGGDHLGPLAWDNMCEQEAIEKAKELIRRFVLAGFTKIHIDTSMRLADDVNGLANETIARRGAELCAVAEQAFFNYTKTKPNAYAPVYVIGSEVPTPGGSQEDGELRVTKAGDFLATVNAFQDAYFSHGLKAAWDRVIAVVVQPGVEFGDASIFEYDRRRAKGLTGALNRHKTLLFEGHSTDYQTPESLRCMVEDGIAILKVGPALTFALREALFSLELIEKEVFSATGVHMSNFKNILEAEMMKRPEHWKKHYHGSMDTLQMKRRFSLSDRSRYYLPVPEVDRAVKRLITNLSQESIPNTLLSQYMPIQYSKVRKGVLAKDPESLLKDRVINCLDEYNHGCGIQ